MKRFCVLILAAFCLTSCHWFEPSGKDRQALLIYLAGNNSLSAEGEADLYDIEQSWLPSVRDKDKGVLIFYHFSDGVPTLSRFYKDRSDVTVEDVIKTYPTSTNSASAATLATVLADAENAWPAERHSLILWSHGSGFLPEGYYAQPKEMAAPGDRLTDAGPDPYAWMVKAGDGSKSFGEDHGSEMDIKEVSQALGVNKYEFILFDACLMANVEIAYELRNNCDYLLFSPTEILADGFPYEKMVQPVFSLNAKGTIRCCPSSDGSAFATWPCTTRALSKRCTKTMFTRTWWKASSSISVILRYGQKRRASPTGCSTRDSVSRRATGTISCCSTGLTNSSLSGGRCWSAFPASVSSGVPVA